MIELTEDKQKRLANLEREIQTAKSVAEKNWYIIGEALLKIRDGKLHPQQTFEQYCLQRWGFKRSHAYRLITGYETVKSLPAGADSEQLTKGNVSRGRQNPKLSGRGVRALAKVPKKDRPKVLEAAKKGGKITEQSIEQAAESITTKADVMEKDKVGRPIPASAMGLWERRKEINPKIRQLQELKGWATDMQGSDDILYRGFDFGALAREAAQLILMLQQIIPDVVCTKCQGQAPDTCDFCKGRGMVSIAKARAYTPVEIKKMVDSNHDSPERLSATGS